MFCFHSRHCKCAHKRRSCPVLFFQLARKANRITASSYRNIGRRQTGLVPRRTNRLCWFKLRHDQLFRFQWRHHSLQANARNRQVSIKKKFTRLFILLIHIIFNSKLTDPLPIANCTFVTLVASTKMEPLTSLEQCTLERQLNLNGSALLEYSRARLI